MKKLRTISIVMTLLSVIATITSAQDKQIDQVVRLIARSEPMHLRARQNLEKILHDQPHFWLELQAIAERLKIQPEWILNVMACESLLNPSARNSLPGQTASGLLQFIEATAQSMGTTTAAIRRMNPVEQLQLVERYFTPFRGRLKNMADVYTTVFRGFVVEGGDATEVVPLDNSSKEKRIYSLNKWLDFNCDEKITKGELVITALTIGRFQPIPYNVSNSNRSPTDGAVQKPESHQTRSIFVRTIATRNN